MGSPPCCGEAASSSSSLDPSKHLEAVWKEANPEPPDVNIDFDLERLSLVEGLFRHSGWIARRRKVWDSLKRVGTGAVALVRFACCGSGAWVQHSASRGRFRVSANLCRSRWCVPCGVARAARLVRAMKAKLNGQDVRFITLTLRHSNTPLKDQLDRLLRSFNALRRRGPWKTTQVGGASFVEVKLAADGRWHVHAHVLAVGGFLDQRELSREWHAVTGDSSIVDIRKVRNVGEVAAYVTKYVTKPLDSSIFADGGRLDEAIATLKGRRLCNPFGIFGKINIDADDDAGPDDWVTVGRLDALFEDAQRGDAVAVMIVAQLTRCIDPAAERHTPAP